MSYLTKHSWPTCSCQFNKTYMCSIPTGHENIVDSTCVSAFTNRMFVADLTLLLFTDQTSSFLCDQTPANLEDNITFAVWNSYLPSLFSSRSIFWHPQSDVFEGPSPGQQGPGVDTIRSFAGLLSRRSLSLHYHSISLPMDSPSASEVPDSESQNSPSPVVSGNLGDAVSCSWLLVDQAATSSVPWSFQ